LHSPEGWFPVIVSQHGASVQTRPNTYGGNNMKKITSIVLAMLMVISMLPSFAVAENKLWTEVEMPDGWTKIINEGGATLGYTKGTGLNIIEADGYAFKDLDVTALWTSSKTGALATKSALRLWLTPACCPSSSRWA